MKRFFIYPIVLLFSSYSFSQESWCGTDVYNEALLQKMNAADAAFTIQQRDKLFESAGQLRQDKSGAVIIVPVVIHVLHDNCVGNISLEQIQDGLRVVNEDFRRINADTSQTRSLFKPFATDVEVEFRLAQIDPNGKCTEGIVRYNTPLSYEAEDNVKSLSYWPSNKYLNVWLVNSIGSGIGSGVLGYAQFPGFGSWSTYGLVVRHDQWGTIGTSNADGRTSTHEIGHCLGLLHTFQSGCGGNCSSSGDRICDTPPSSQATWSCNNSQNSCGNDASGPSKFSSNVVDQIENYMSYDNCQNMFTIDQADVMQSVFSTYSTLSNLISSSNLTATGTNNGFVVSPCAPKADLCMEKTSVCEGSEVTYTDLSYNGPIVSRTWSFPGGSPASSSDSVVTVTYNIPGTYEVNLTVGNSSGSNSKDLSNIVTVYSAGSDLTKWRYDESFEDPDSFDTLWSVVNASGGRKWELTGQAAYSGSNSVYISNYINGPDLMDELISPSYDLSAVASPKFTFKGAYAMKSSSSADFFKIYYSYNCGYTWNVMGVLTAGLMTSVSDFRTSEFIPADVSEWREFSYPLSSFLAEKQNVRFKFEFTSGGGNNFYIDDINIENITGLEETTNLDEIIIYPNPADHSFYIDTKGSSDLIERIEIMDLSGRTIKTINTPEFSDNQNYPILVDVSDLAPSMYIIRFTALSKTVEIRKMMVR